MPQRPIPIISAGRHQATDYSWHEFSVADLEEIAAAFSAAPFVPGHPRNDEPKLGTATRVEVRDGILWATEYEADATFQSIVNSGEMPGVSAWILLPGHPQGDPKAHRIKHIGFLGRSLPADSSLPDAKFASPKYEAIFSAPTSTQEEEEPMSGTNTPANQAPATAPAEEVATPDTAAAQAEIDRRLAELEEKEAAFSRRRQIEPELEAHVRAGRLLPGEKEGFVELFAAMPGSLEVAFSRPDGEVKQTAGDFLKEFLGQLPSRIDYGETAPANQTTSEAAFSAASGQQQSSEDKVRAAMKKKFAAARR